LIIKLASLFFLMSMALAVVPGNSLFPSAYASADQQYTREQLVTMYPGFYFYRGSSEAKKVALTFDDGPDDQVTPQILDILKDNSVKGTFFLIGSYASLHPDIVRRIAAEGNVIANHTWSHPNMARLSPAQAREEIAKTENLLRQTTGYRTALLRPPKGRVSTSIMDLAQKEGYRVIGWSVDSADWRDPQAARIATRLHNQIHPGAIILMHAVAFPKNQGSTVKVLPALIKELKAQGYQLVTIDELLHIPVYGSLQPNTITRRDPAF